MFKVENVISAELIAFFKKNQIIVEGEKLLKIEKPGEGNMNQVVRIVTDQKSVIIKQSRDYVNKYPTIAAPIERIFVEAAFYNAISDNEILKNKMPKLLGFSEENYLLVLEDLGKNSDYSEIYKQNSSLSKSEIKELVNYLNELHTITVSEFANNTELKKLNHFHIFNFPFQVENGYDLDNIQDGLQEIALKYKKDDRLKSKIQILGEKYLETQHILIHGDYYPGSWLKTEHGIKIIDPEFGYLGLPEFDLGVFLAHLYMARKEELVKVVMENYYGIINPKLILAFTGIEILRRILGVAQLPLSLNIIEIDELLQKAKTFIDEYEN